MNYIFFAEAAQVADAIPESRGLIDPVDRLQKLRSLEAQCRKGSSKPSND